MHSFFLGCSVFLFGSPSMATSTTRRKEEEEEEEEEEASVRATMQQQQLPQSWWFGSLNNSRRSPWLISTLAEHDEKTKQMLRLVEDDADSFAKRAETYYKKRPQLVSMIEDFRRAHRSLAVRCDQLRSGGAARRVTAALGPSQLDRSWARSISSNKGEVESRSSASESSEESEVDDPEQGGERRARETPDADLAKLMGEVERLKEENAALNSEIAGKDEEKRDVIRQLALSLQILKEEHAGLRMCIKDGKKGAIS
ncbi:KIP1-like protein [Musa troglodytarum]|nr:KIP1-like protein [Musa troglodytarum]